MRDLHLKPDLYRLPHRKGTAIGVDYYRGEPGFRYHYHPEYELTLVRGSVGRRMVGGTISNFAECDLVLLGPYLPHTWASEPYLAKGVKKENIVVHFTPESLGLDFLARRELRGVSRLLDRSRNGLSFDVGDMGGEILLANQLSRLRGLSALVAFLGILNGLSRCRKTTVLSRASGKAETVEREHLMFAKVVDYVHDNALRPISLEEMAAHVNMSVSNFCRVFHRVSGQSFVDYLNDWRISRACLLLEHPEHSITEISGLVGYDNLSHFNRQFLRRQGMTPREFRAKSVKKTHPAGGK